MKISSPLITTAGEVVKQPFSSLTTIISHITDILTETLVICDEEGTIKAVLAPGKNSFSDDCELNKTLDAILGCELESCRTAIEEAAKTGEITAEVNAKYTASLHVKRYEAERNRFCIGITEHPEELNQNSASLIESAVFNSNDHAIAILDSNFTLQAVNQGFCQLLGVNANQAIGRPPFFLDNVSDALASERVWSALSSGNSWKGEFFVPQKDGSEKTVWLSIEAVKHKTKPASHLLVFSDITQQQKDKAKLSNGAYTDALTGLANGEALHSHLSKSLKRHKSSRQSYAFFLIDINKFQSVNEAIGYELSNKVLVTIAEFLKSFASEKDYVARIGGDQFALILRDVGEKTTLAKRAKAVLAQFEKPLEIERYRVEISISIGACIFPSEDIENAIDLIKKTDTALLDAKRKGNNQFSQFTAAQLLKRNEFFQLEMGLRQALAMKQLSLSFQPQYDIRHNNITGAEVLTRWNHPILGVIPPSRFIPVAEKSGYIDSLGDWILEQAISQLGEWQSSGMPLSTLSINLSRQQLINPNLVSRVKELIKTHAVRPQLIEFEVSENNIACINKVAEQTLIALSDLGCQLALDNFGCHGASLVHLKRFKFQRIKLDQGFISGIPQVKEDAAMVQAVLVFAKSLGINAIAEGVETEQQANFLMRYGCNHQQGHLYSQALPAKDYADIVNNGRSHHQ